MTRAAGLIFILICVSVCPPAYAETETSIIEATGITPESIPAGPQKPTPPAAIPQPRAPEPFRCERKFVYQGKVFDCDSNVQRDAERLRPLMTDVPAALADLDTYQRNRQNVRDAAYVGSVGLFLVIAGLLASRTFTDTNGNLTNTGTQVRSYSAFGGGGLVILSVAYGWATLYRNESYVDDAVKLHNEAHPNTPIQLQLGTGFTF